MLRTESERISIHNTTLDNKNLVVISFIVKLFLSNLIFKKSLTAHSQSVIQDLELNHQ